MVANCDGKAKDEANIGLVPPAFEKTIDDQSVAEESTPVASPKVGHSENYDLGLMVAMQWAIGIDTVSNALKDLPPAEIRTRVAVHLNLTFSTILSLGKQREALDQVGKEEFDSAVTWEVVLPHITEDQVQVLDDAIEAYREKDPELSEYLKKIKIVGKYSNYDYIRENDKRLATANGL